MRLNRRPALTNKSCQAIKHVRERVERVDDHTQRADEPLTQQAEATTSAVVPVCRTCGSPCLQAYCERRIKQIPKGRLWRALRWQLLLK
jgi:hypothetical protein